jgi:tetratricopeptide (TPR) repeat protein
MFGKLGKALRSRPKTLLALAFFVVVALVTGFYFYALHEWHAAQRAVREGRPQEARDRLALCLFLWGGNSEVHLLAARTARLSGDYERADAHLKKCMKLDKGATAATQLEYLLMRAQTGEEDIVADSLFALVDQKHPESITILESFARIYMHEHRYGLAIECLNRWIKETPNAARPLYWRGWVLERVRQFSDAMSDYERALELDPDLVPVRLRVAEMLLEKKDPLAAQEHLERLRKQSSEPAIVARLGQCRFLQGKNEEARKLLEDAEKKLPDDPALLICLGKLDIQDEREAMAEKRLRRALKADVTDLEALYTLVTCLQLQGRKKEASAALDQYKERKNSVDQVNHLLQAEAKNPTKGPDPPSKIGALFISIGHERLGLYWLEQALLRDPRHRESHKILAEYYESKGQKDKAALHRKRLQALQKDGTGAGK